MKKTVTKDKPSVEQKTISPKPAINRVFKGDAQVHHDLFALKPAEMTKDMGWGNSPFYVKVLHQHFYHSVDSAGKPQINSTNIGGHFHKMKINHDEKTNTLVASCVSGPLNYAVRKIRGKRKKVEVSASVLDEEGNPMDNHTHETVYIRSENVKLRQVSSYAANYEAQDAQKVAPISGVIS